MLHVCPCFVILSIIIMLNRYKTRISRILSSTNKLFMSKHLCFLKLCLVEVFSKTCR